MFVHEKYINTTLSCYTDIRIYEDNLQRKMSVKYLYSSLLHT